MAVEFKPVSKLWNGVIVVKKIKYLDRLQMLIDAGVKIDMNGGVGGQDNLLELILMQFKFVSQVVEKVDVVGVDGTKLDSLDDLMEYEGGKEVIKQVFDFASKEQTLGKPRKKS